MLGKLGSSVASFVRSPSLVRSLGAVPGGLRSIQTAPLLVKGGTVVNADQTIKADVRMDGGKITEVRPDIEPMKGEEVIDATGKHVLPGGIETHTHLELNFMGAISPDDFFHGTKAGLAGGTTTVCDFILPAAGTSLKEALLDWRARADEKVTCDYTLHCAVTSWSDEVAKDMAHIVKEGVTSFKFFLAYKDAFQLDDTELYHGFSRAKQLGAISQVHAENGDLCLCGQKRMLELGITGPEGHTMSRPAEVEAEATHRAITIAQAVNTPLYVVHVMTKLAAEEIGRARDKGFKVFGEPIAAGLGVDGQKYFEKDYNIASRYVMGPPLAEDPSDKLALMNRLASGVLQTVGTDNCTFNLDQKKMGEDDFTKIPNGVNGVQDRMSLVWNHGVEAGILTPNQFVGVTSTNAAKIFGMYPQKGIIAPGSDADLVVWDGDASRTVSAKTHQHAVDFNIFEGMTLKGVAEKTVSQGELVWKDGEFTDAMTKGRGNFIARKPFGWAFEGVDKSDAHNDPLKRKVDRS